jgi:hypothetical protein
VIITAISGMLLASVYFYASFWLFAETGAAVAGHIISDVTFSITIIVTLFAYYTGRFGTFMELSAMQVWQ